MCVVYACLCVCVPLEVGGADEAEPVLILYDGGIYYSVWMAWLAGAASPQQKEENVLPCRAARFLNFKLKPHRARRDDLFLKKDKLFRSFLLYRLSFDL